MATGASTADLAVVLVDARKGLLTQTRRHSYIAALLGIRHVVLAVNKMDLVGYDQRGVRRDRRRLPRAGRARSASPHVQCDPAVGAERRQPAAARRRDAVVRRPGAARVPGDGRARRRRRPTCGFRLPVQWVNRPEHATDFRGFAGTLVAGGVRAGRRRRRAAVGPALDASRACSAPMATLDAARAGPGGHADARRRDRRQPRRRARRGRRSAAGRRPVRRAPAVDGRTSRCCRAARTG